LSFLRQDKFIILIIVFLRIIIPFGFLAFKARIKANEIVRNQVKQVTFLTKYRKYIRLNIMGRIDTYIKNEILIQKDIGKFKHLRQLKIGFNLVKEIKFTS